MSSAPSPPFDLASLPQLAQLALPVGIIQMTPSGACTFVNPRWCAQTGLTWEEARDYGWVSYLHPEDQAMLPAALARAVDSDETSSFEYRIVPPRGLLRWLRSDTLPLHDRRGEVVGLLATVTDITRRVSSEQRFRLLFEQSSEPYLFLDEVGHVEACNQATLQLLGLDDASELLGVGLLTRSPAVQPDGRRSVDKARVMHALCLLRGSHRYPWSLQRGDEAIPVEITSTCLLLEGRRALLVSMHDLTAQKRIEEAVLRSREAALEALQAKSQFLANMSHEIRTPMNGVLGMLHLLLGTPLGEDQREYAMAAHASASGLLAIIDDILDLSKMEAKRLVVEATELSLESVLRDTLRVVSGRAHDKGLELLLAVGEDVPAHLTGDPVRLRQVLTNLSGNAIKFTERGEVALRVTRRGTEASPRLRFEVCDSGIGIPPESLERIFQAFSQADGSITRRYGGTGLGLTISRELVALMGGELSAESEPGRGSTFSFELPLQGPTRQRAPAPRPPDPMRRRVLVIDDHPTAREIAAGLVAELGFDPVPCASIAEALPRLREDAPHYWAALVDQTLPGESASELGLRLEEEVPSSTNVRLVLLCAGEPVRGALLRDAGFTRKLHKPVLRSELAAALCEVEPRPFVQRASAASPTRAVIPRRVLLVEDHPINMRFMTVLLQRQGHGVTHAANGSEGVREFAAGAFDIVLMDVQMPVMDGLEATRRIRALERERGSSRVPIVALTAHAMHGNEDECLAAGMDGYLSKPIDADTLARTLDELPHPSQHGSSELPGEGVVRPPEAVVLAAAPCAAREPPYDRAALLERACGDESFMRDILQLLRASTDDMIEEVTQSAAGDDIERMRGAAHRLKGALEQVCAHPSARIAQQLETAACEGQRDALGPLAERLQQELLRLVRALDA